MGFKDRVFRNTHENIFNELSNFRNSITDILSINKDDNIEIYQFSDSIVFFSSDVTSKSFESISNVASKTLAKAICSGIPLKGAIARGMITCDSSKQLFFWQALIDAYLLEESIQYYGLLAHHTVEEYAIELSSKLYRNVSAPLKSGAVGHYELMWYSNGQQSLEYIQECLIKIRYTVSDSPRKYIDNTLSIIDTYNRDNK